MSRIVSVIVLLLLAVTNAPAQEPLADKVRISIEKGVKYLRQAQRPDGSWEVNLPTVEYQGGWTCLALLALMNSGVPPEDPTVARGLRYLRSVESNKTYVRALQAMALAEANQPEDLERIQRNVQWLIEAMVMRNGHLQGWSYGKGGVATTDNSNTQYALLGLWAGRQAGVKLPRKIWESIQSYYEASQIQDGGWSYTPRAGGAAGGATLTMTEAGVCGLLMASMELELEMEAFDKNDRATNCGTYHRLESLQAGLNWISGPKQDRLVFEIPQRIFYNIYGIERVGRLSGQRFLGRHDWYREGCQYLTGVQSFDGSWSSRGAWDSWPVVSTSFSLLFLSKGRTPVLISKLVHTASWPRDDGDTDWNNDRNDLRHLTEYVGKELFKMPLAWQNFDMMRAATPRVGGAGLNDEDMAEVTSDLLQSPILYFNGHQSPERRFRPIEKELLKKYVDNGGFILAEACCDSQQFDRGFKALAAELWPDSTLVPLDAQHPIWTTHFRVTPGDPYTLYGVNQGCKTVVVYSPQDMSCQWEGNRQKTARGDRAFKLGANIVAYATGMEPPKPRLTQTEVSIAKDDFRNIPRGYLKVAQLKHTGDWQPAPRAMRNLMEHLRKHAGVDVSLKTEELQVGSKAVVDFKFLYMQGRSEFRFSKEQMKYLRFNLENGGLLLADACCGKEAFDRAFRQFAKELFPDKPLEKVPADDPLFSKELNGESLTDANISCRLEQGKPFRNVTPQLEGIRVGDRWVVLYSKYDLGCALEKHNATECLGYETRSAYRIATAAALYSLSP